MLEYHGKDSNSSSLLNISLVDRLWDFSWLLKIIYLSFFIDVMSLLMFGKGIFSWSFGEIPRLSIGDIVGVMITFGLFAIIVLPFCSYFLFFFLTRLKYNIFIASDESARYRDDYGYVSLYELKNEAINEQSSFIMSIFNDEMEKVNRFNINMLKAEKISVGLTLLAISEWYLSSSNGETKCFIDRLWELVKLHDDTTSHSSVAFLLVAVLISFSVAACWPRDLMHKVYYPPLYHKKKEHQKKQQEEQMQWEREFNSYNKN